MMLDFRSESDFNRQHQLRPRRFLQPPRVKKKNNHARNKIGDPRSAFDALPRAFRFHPRLSIYIQSEKAKMSQPLVLAFCRSLRNFIETTPLL